MCEQGDAGGSPPGEGSSGTADGASLHCWSHSSHREEKQGENSPGIHFLGKGDPVPLMLLGVPEGFADGHGLAFA